MTLRVGTRSSHLALAQTKLFVDSLLSTNRNLSVETLIIHSQGDRLLHLPLAELSKLEKGLFTRELELALLSKKIDVAIHSLKDLPISNSDSPLTIGAILPREDTRDILIWKSPPPVQAGDWKNYRIGTSSPRRSAQLLEMFPGSNPVPIRGNVTTRLQKLLSDSTYDAILLAVAGLKRLNYISPTLEWTELARGFSSLQLMVIDSFLPAPAQGAIAAQIRSNDSNLLQILQSVHCQKTAVCVQAERALLQLLGGGCAQPIAALAEFVTSEEILLRAAFYPTSHPPAIHAQARVPATTPLLASEIVAQKFQQLSSDSRTISCVYKL
ncbi:MAG: hydroxymethylbilane synthase [Chthoniobacterales bacterium]|nr:hydroxymethylbilane synthase [Chthoniobacterales bacterium]